MKKFTYLLGAGASANVFPINSKLKPEREKSDEPRINFFDELEGFRTHFKHEKQPEESLDKELQEIIGDIAFFGTPDICAKYYLESGNDKYYIRLITLLSNYFTYKQETANLAMQVFSEEIRNQKGNGKKRSKVEVRALKFLATITTDKKIPKNIRILTWNYDRQIEIAAEQLKLRNNTTHEKVSGFTCWPNVSEAENAKTDEPTPFLLHLNGVAGYYYTEKSISNYAIDYLNFDERESLLSFAWQNESNTQKSLFIENRIKKAKAIAKNTNIIIIIGYSFPYFNREIDKKLFKVMIESGPFEKIYFQDPHNDGKFLSEQLELPGNIKIEHINDVDNYYIPSEF